MSSLRKVSKKVYACTVDWEHELGWASDLEGAMPLYTKLEKLKRERECVSQCGIVRLEIKYVRTVKRANYEDLK